MLASESSGPDDAPVLLFLHGLLGSRRNWRAVCKRLSQDYRCHALDLLNHGDSPHQKDATVPAMTEALRAWAQAHLAPKEKTFTLCGHSLGGKVAMKYAALYPGTLHKLVIADIAPRDYPQNHHLATLDALLAVDLPNLQTRKDADDALASAFPDPFFRQFQLTNLTEEKSGEGNENTFRWKPNLSSLRSHLSKLSANPLAPTETHHGPTLFLTGGKSNFVRPQDHATIRKHFPQAQITALPDAGHFIQAEDKAGFLQAFTDFLKQD